MPQFVSLTGADDNVPIESLWRVERDALARGYARPEWALLYLPEKEGAARVPSAAWRERFLGANLTRTAAHLCGERVFRDLLAGRGAHLAHLRRYGRLQLNINARERLFSDQEVCNLYDRLLGEGCRLILQYHSTTALLIERYLEHRPPALGRCAVLFDGSRGKGLVPQGWAPPLTLKAGQVMCGYAGGLSPQTVVQALEGINGARAGAPVTRFWIDMESGLRTPGNEFDVGKAAEVLRLVAREKADA